jgi:hypothetical protein
MLALQPTLVKVSSIVVVKVVVVKVVVVKIVVVKIVVVVFGKVWRDVIFGVLPIIEGFVASIASIACKTFTSTIFLSLWALSVIHAKVSSTQRIKSSFRAQRGHFVLAEFSRE